MGISRSAWTLTTLQGGQDPAYTSFVPPPLFLQDPQGPL